MTGGLSAQPVRRKIAQSISNLTLCLIIIMLNILHN